MKMREAKEFVRKIVADYFGDSHVFYADEKMAKLPEPFVTVMITGYSRQEHPNALMDECELKNYKQIVASVDLNLYTKGKDVSGGRGVPHYANTAMDDMEDFLQYLESEMVIERCGRADMVILINGQVRDLTALVNGSSQFNYRSMVELDVRFTAVSAGLYGQTYADRLPNDSNGGNPDMLEPLSTIENINTRGEIE